MALSPRPGAAGGDAGVGRGKQRPYVMVGDHKGRPYVMVGDHKGRPYVTVGDHKGRPYVMVRRPTRVAPT